MSRYIDADALIADMRERYCKPCQSVKKDYNGVKCRACWVDDAMDDVDGFGDNGIDIVRCRDCKYDHKCNHSVQRITSKPDYMSIIYVPIGWCERGERNE